MTRRLSGSGKSPDGHSLARERQSDVLSLLHNGNPVTGIPYSYSEIAKFVGLSRERVRQLAMRWTGETGRQRQGAIRAAEPPKPPQPPQPPRPPTRAGWLKIYRRWLAEVGSAWCTTGRHIVPSMDMTLCVKTSKYKCKACRAADTQKWYATPHGKATLQKWQAANPDKLRAAMQRYYQRHKAAINAKARAQRLAAKEANQ